MTCLNPFTTTQIRQYLQDHCAQVKSATSSLAERKAAVLVPIICREDGWHILYTRRSVYVNDHKGQVSFPGGGREAEDSSLEETALREAEEEIGTDPKQVEILGRLEDFVTRSGFVITPVVGQLPWPVKLSLNCKEVSRVFSIPITWLASPDHYEIRPYKAKNGHVDKIYFFEPYDGEQLWGISAHITLQLLEALGLISHRLI